MSAPPRDDVLAHRAFTTRLPPPGSGRTRARFRRLWSWAAVSPTLGRLAEAHHDARAGGPRMLALGTDVQLRLAEVELYRRQCHAESDLEVLGSIAAERDVGAPDQPGAPTLDQRSGS